MPKSPILGGFSIARSKNASDSEAINIGVEVTETKDGKVPGFLFGMSGLDLFATLGTGPIRGAATLQDMLYVVSGKEVYSLTPNGVATLCGVIGLASSLVSMFANNRQLMIVDGVGAWLVPGGYPLTGGTIQHAGGLYALGDTVTLLPATGTQSSYPILTVTAISDNPVLTFGLPNAGATYTSASSVATTSIQPQGGRGTGLEINITSTTNSGVTGSTLAAGGANYAVGDTGVIAAGGRNAAYLVTGQSGGAVTSYIIVNGGNAYATGSALPTTRGGGATNNLGSGLTLNITAPSGPITASSLADGGAGYGVGNAGYVSGGTGDATYLVLSVGPNGAITEFEVTQPGAIGSPTFGFTQKSTSGSGSGFTLLSPTYGAFVGLVPVSVPFPAPLIGSVSDGFGLLIFTGQQNLAASDELDLSTWQALSFGVADQSPDNCVSLAVIHDEAYVLKQRNTEVWVDQGLPNFAFGPLTGVHMEAGCAATFSVAIADEELIWLSQNSQGQAVFVKAKAYQVEPIGTQALTDRLQKFPNIGDCIAYVRQEGGHVYYVATFPEANETWCYDKTASGMVGYPIWTRLAAFDNGAWNRHWGNCFTPWRGSVSLVETTTGYTAQSVVLGATTALQTASGLNGLPLSFTCFVFSAWLNLPDSSAAGIVFSNQSGASSPGISITINNDSLGDPEMTIEAWDASSAAIVVATYDFAGWDAWVNVLVSVDTATQKIQVWANTIASETLVESELSAASLTWSSSNPIGAPATQRWALGLAV